MPMKHIFDRAELLDNFGGDESLAQSILNQALPEIEKDVEKLREACSNADMQAVGRCAHSTKGMASNLCAPALEGVCRKIEHAIMDGDLETARSCMPELEQTALMTLKVIRGELQ